MAARLQYMFHWAILIAAIAAHVALWSGVRDFKGRWQNVPPVPGRTAALAGSLGDAAFAYRGYGLMLQNLGNTGGRTERFENYDYSRLKDWFLLTWDLDQRSNFAPFLASYYFSAVKDPEKLPPLVDYLEVAGQGTQGLKWPWLAQAVYIARFQMHDYSRAYELANRLAALGTADLPSWAAQMPGLVLTQKGDRRAAYEFMVELLKTSGDKMHPAEVNSMLIYICTRILTPEEAKTNALCGNIKW